MHGLPTSWEPVVATIYDRDVCSPVAWSSCNRFVAVTNTSAAEIRDAVTLDLLRTFEFSPRSRALLLCFSPDNRLLTRFDFGNFITWDIQTGGSVHAAFPKGLCVDHLDFSSTYSLDGRMLAVVYLDQHLGLTFVATHDLSTADTHLYRVPEGRIMSPIWTHDESLRFATVDSGSITIWEVEFTLAHAPEITESFPAPDEATGAGTFHLSLFHPTISRLAIAFRATLLVWDTRDSKLLLRISPFSSTWMSFSSNGYFASVHRRTKEAHVWKDSPTGYILHQRLAFSVLDDHAIPLLSPNGESIIISLPPMVHLWRTRDPILPSGPTLAFQNRTFTLGFSPNETSVAFARETGDNITILDLQSGDPRFVIEAGMEIWSLGVTASAVVVASKKKIVTWALPTGNARMNIDDIVRITTFDLPPPFQVKRQFFFMSVSPDLSRIATLSRTTDPWAITLDIYGVSTGRSLAVTTVGDASIMGSWFSPDGREIWGASFVKPSPDGWEIVEDGEFGNTRLQPLGETVCPLGMLPWKSSLGYEVTDDGWILGPSQQRLLWLPHHWRERERCRRWAGRFLGLLHGQLSEVVILEFFG